MAISGGSNPISKHIDEILKEENRKLPAAELPREEKDAPPAAGGDERNIDDLGDLDDAGEETPETGDR
ncbi:hypothetical protein [Pigmentiphaga sp.]|uniref:hypothetical protein n=1 Tax=Pigmentiphaga sp. TaxID=1977564 RepID=UPI0025F3AE1D|nr:hypothetical protein [Pigmentiphaga sp.]MBX6318509.1 hypothetical protein [Pigmentiphaga sp.]